MVEDSLTMKISDLTAEQMQVLTKLRQLLVLYPARVLDPMRMLSWFDFIYGFGLALGLLPDQAYALSKFIRDNDHEF